MPVAQRPFMQAIKDAADPEIAGLWRTLQDQGLRGMTLAARGLREQGALRPGLSIARAADILWLYVGPWTHRVLVTERGWTLDDYERWLADTLHSQLMDPAASRPPA